jgi:tRNA-dihydrouridine synthase
MLGRGILKNPFLAEQIQKKSSSAAAEEDWKIRFYNFYKDLASTYLSIKPESATLANFKELWHYFSILYKLTPLQLQQLLRIKSWDDFFAKTLEIIVSEHV